MKNMKLIVLLTLIALVAVACKKEAPTNANAPAAKPANASPAPTPAPVAKTPVKPVATEGGDNVYSHPESGMQFEVPTAWKAEADGEVMTLTAADDSLSVIFWVPKEGTVEEALNALDAELGKVIKHIKPSG